MGGEPTTINRNAVLWRDIGRLGLIIVALAAFYTLYVVFFRPEGFLDWINTLLSTLFSVFAALVIGLLLFTFQTGEADRKKKVELTRLLRSELLDLKKTIEETKSVVPEEALKQDIGSYEIRVSLHFANPLIVEEAVRSGLFDERQTTEMLRLARNMKAHQVRLQDVTTTNFWTHMYYISEKNPLSFQEHREMSIRYAEVARSVQRSEERIIEGCGALLDTLDEESQKTG